MVGRVYMSAHIPSSKGKIGSALLSGRTESALLPWGAYLQILGGLLGYCRKSTYLPANVYLRKSGAMSIGLPYVLSGLLVVLPGGCFVDAQTSPGSSTEFGLPCGFGNFEGLHLNSTPEGARRVTIGCF